MDFKEDFSQLLRIQLFSQFEVEVDSHSNKVTVITSGDLSFPLIFELVKESAILCYDRLIYRRRLSEMKVPLSVIVRNEDLHETIHFPANSKSLKTS